MVVVVGGALVVVVVGGALVLVVDGALVTVAAGRSTTGTDSSSLLRDGGVGPAARSTEELLRSCSILVTCSGRTGLAGFLGVGPSDEDGGAGEGDPEEVVGECEEDSSEAGVLGKWPCLEGEGLAIPEVTVTGCS